MTFSIETMYSPLFQLVEHNSSAYSQTVFPFHEMSSLSEFLCTLKSFQRLKAIPLKRSYSSPEAPPPEVLPRPDFVKKLDNSVLIPSWPLKLGRSVSVQPLEVNDSPPMCVVCCERCAVRVPNLCPNTCTEMDMCLPCSRSFWMNWVTDNRFTVGPPRCLGCKLPLAFARWKSTVGPTVLAQFEAHLWNVFMMRCPSCDSDYHFKPEQVQVPSSLSLLEFMNHDEDLLALFQDFASYKDVSAKPLVDYLIFARGVESTRALICPPSFIHEIQRETLGDDFEEPELVMVDLLQDNVERQASLLLEFMRRPEAKVSTGCCNSPVCFACKWESWHPDQTCEEIIEQSWKDSLGDEKIYVCPNCYVQFLHSGGCNYIRCICSHEFSLEEMPDLWH